MMKEFFFTLISGGDGRVADPSPQEILRSKETRLKSHFITLLLFDDLIYFWIKVNLVDLLVLLFNSTLKTYLFHLCENPLVFFHKSKVS